MSPSWPLTGAAFVDPPLDRLGLELDPVRDAQRKALRVRYLNTVEIPRLRAFGCTLLIMGALLHNRFLLGDAPWVGWYTSAATTLVMVGILAGYALASWLVLATLWDRIRGFNLGTCFLTLDVFVWASTIYLTGGTRSWLFFITLARVADQTPIGFRRALFFAHLAPAGYALVAVADFLCGVPISWLAEACKVLFIYIVAVYIAFVARTAERRQAQRASVIRIAKRLIGDLGEKSAQLEEANRRMEEAGRAKEEFLANVSHEIRTPLSAIIGMTQLAVEVKDPADRQRYLEKLKGSADSLLAVINDILDFSRIDAGRFSLETAPFALHDVINAVVDTVRIAADQKGLDLRYDIAPAVPDRLVGDAARLRQILLNLMANAVKFTERGKVALTVDCRARRQHDVVIHMAVSDTGIGIPAEKQQLVFEAFAQVDGSTTRRYGGTGLGLSIASRLAKLMGGDVSLESEAGRGSTFHVTVRCGLPLEDQVAPPQRDAPPEGAAPARPGLRVLVADDNTIQRDVVSHLLDGGGHQVVAVSSGTEAVAAFRRGGIDIVLLDLQMPDTDGFQTAAAIRRLEPPGARVPIVAITASAMTRDRDRCREVGITDFLWKPVRKKELLAVVGARERLV